MGSEQNVLTWVGLCNILAARVGSAFSGSENFSSERANFPIFYPGGSKNPWVRAGLAPFLVRVRSMLGGQVKAVSIRLSVDRPLFHVKISQKKLRILLLSFVCENQIQVGLMVMASGWSSESR